jgi:hypothetical protein
MELKVSARPRSQQRQVRRRFARTWRTDRALLYASKVTSSYAAQRLALLDQARPTQKARWDARSFIETELV